MLKIVFFFCVILIAGFLKAQQFRIGVLRDYNVKRVNFAYLDGSYAIFGDTSYLGSILPNEYVDLTIQDNKILLKKGTTELGEFDKVLLIQNQLNTGINITSKNPVVKTRKYKDDFEISILKNKGLNVVNVVQENNYLSGVVESEGGGGRHLEYYKVQAIISRTYAYKYKSKHEKEGFDLCDRTHCQAYHQMQRYTPLIDSAVIQTKSKVIVDEKDQLIDAYFHANCGGQTCEPQYVWNSQVPYLKSFVDTFCIYTKQATWEKRINKETWKNFIVKNYNYPIEDSVYANQLFNFDQTTRKAFYLHPAFGIPLRDLRDEFQLKSTFFSCKPEGEDVVLYGKGFGHGVGLCQEGAMKMAKSGIKSQQIIEFYFNHSKVIEMHQLEFFKQKPDLKNFGY